MSTAELMVGGGENTLSALVEALAAQGLSCETYGCAVISYPAKPRNAREKRQADIARVPLHFQRVWTFLPSRVREEFACICIWLLICDYEREGRPKDPRQAKVYNLCWAAVRAFYRATRRPERFAPADPRLGSVVCLDHIERAFLSLSVVTREGMGMRKACNRLFAPALLDYLKPILPSRRTKAVQVCPRMISNLYHFVSTAEQIKKARQQRRQKSNHSEVSE